MVYCDQYAVAILAEAREREAAEALIQLRRAGQLALDERAPVGIITQLDEAPRAPPPAEPQARRARTHFYATVQHVGEVQDGTPHAIQALDLDGTAQQHAQRFVVDARVGVELLPHPHQQLVLRQRQALHRLRQLRERG